MKKHPSSVIASCVIIFKKVSGSRVSRSHGGNTAAFYTLYIIYIYNGNNDADDTAQAGRGFPARHHPCHSHSGSYYDAFCRAGLRHSHSVPCVVYSGPVTFNHMLFPIRVDPRSSVVDSNFQFQVSSF